MFREFLFPHMQLLFDDGEGSGGGSGKGEGGEGSGQGAGAGEGGSGEGSGGAGSGGSGGGEEKPPWGDEEENFDAKRAWKLIQDTRADAKKAKDERAKLAKEKADREEAEKSEEQKREEAKTKAEAEAKSSKLEALRLKVALRKGLNETQAKRLVGETEEELEKDADELLESFKSSEEEEEEEGGQAPRRPRERKRPGAVPKAEGDEDDPRKLADQVPAGY